MIPLLLASTGLVLLVAGALALRRTGTAWRVGRLIAATPLVTIPEAAEIARSGRARFVGVGGRIDSETDFEDRDHRPLVLRRTRYERQVGRRWVAVSDDREAVPFELHEGLDAIAVDHVAADLSLAVVPRIAVGIAGDLGDDAPDGLDASTPVRVRIEQVSSVEHAIVLGIPEAVEAADAAPAAAGAPTVRLTNGLGRPLIISTLEPDEAMRVLAADAPGLPRIAGALLAIGLALMAVALVWLIGSLLLGSAAAAAAATPSAGPGGGDPRTPGEGPGLVGEPGLAVLAVLGIAVLSIAVVGTYVRLTGGRGGRGSGAGSD